MPILFLQECGDSFTEFTVAPIHIGSHVQLHSLVSNHKFNQREGFVVNRNDNGDHWGVVLYELEGSAGVRKIWNLKPSNLSVLASYTGLMVTPFGNSEPAKIEPFEFGRGFGNVIAL